jgi:hypothetical protein
MHPFVIRVDHKMYLHLYKIWDYRNVICIFAFSYGQTVIPLTTGTRIHDKGGMDRLLAVSVWPVGFIWQVFYIRPQTFPVRYVLLALLTKIIPQPCTINDMNPTGQNL